METIKVKRIDQRVIVNNSPISERYWYEGCEGLISGDQIKITGCWFPFDKDDKRWNVTYLSDGK